MQFSAGRPDLVRAINQRWLLKFWERHSAGQQMPAVQTIEAENLTSVKANLSLLAIVAGTPPRFRIMFHGETIGKVYGSTNCRGKCLDEVVPPARYAHAQMPYAEVVRSRCPVYTIHDVTDGHGRLVHYERLLLPFGKDESDVDHILASFEFICEDGAFDNRELMMTQTSAPVLRLSATIHDREMA